MAALRAAVFSAIREKPEGWAFFAPPPPPVRVLTYNTVSLKFRKLWILWPFFKNAVGILGVKITKRRKSETTIL